MKFSISAAVAAGLFAVSIATPALAAARWRTKHSREVQSAIDGNAKVARGHNLCQALRTQRVDGEFLVAIPVSLYKVPANTPVDGDFYCPARDRR